MRCSGRRVRSPPRLVGREGYGMRWQSEAATPLFVGWTNAVMTVMTVMKVVSGGGERFGIVFGLRLGCVPESGVGASLCHRTPYKKMCLPRFFRNFHSAVMSESSPDWPRAPVHRLSQSGTYFVTVGTYTKAHHFRSRERLSV